MIGNRLRASTRQWQSCKQGERRRPASQQQRSSALGHVPSPLALNSSRLAVGLPTKRDLDIDRLILLPLFARIKPEGVILRQHVNPVAESQRIGSVHWPVWID